MDLNQKPKEGMDLNQKQKPKEGFDLAAAQSFHDQTDALLPHLDRPASTLHVQSDIEKGLFNKPQFSTMGESKVKDTLKLPQQVYSGLQNAL
jgi:hypothetical protein